MTHILETRPRPVCILTTHPARAHLPDTDVRRTWAQHTPIHTPAPQPSLMDDYDLVSNQDWLSAPGGLR